MQFTGERFIPSLKGQIRYGHLHRYAIACTLADDKVVLDIASGEGYGSVLLAQAAREVVGVDIAPDVVSHANYIYSAHTNLKFITGACDAVPLPNQYFDLIVSFETLEHHEQHDEMMCEIRRLLKPHGLFILSTPNRPVFDTQIFEPNPFHPKELDNIELMDLLQQHFQHIQLLGQRLFISSFVFPLDTLPSKSFVSYVPQPNRIGESVPQLETPMYFIALCSNAEFSLPALPLSMFSDGKDDIYFGLIKQMIEQHHLLQKRDDIYLDLMARIMEGHRQLQKLDDDIKWMRQLKFWRVTLFYWGLLARLRRLFGRE